MKKSESLASKRVLKQLNDQHHNYDVVPNKRNASDSGQFEVKEIDVAAALDKVEVLPIAHSSSQRLGENKGSIAQQNQNKNRRLSAIEEEDKYAPED